MCVGVGVDISVDVGAGVGVGICIGVGVVVSIRVGVGVGIGSGISIGTGMILLPCQGCVEGARIQKSQPPANGSATKQHTSGWVVGPYWLYCRLGKYRIHRMVQYVRGWHNLISHSISWSWSSPQSL